MLLVPLDEPALQQQRLGCLKIGVSDQPAGVLLTVGEVGNGAGQALGPEDGGHAQRRTQQVS
jgi:hypothetical protein